MSYCNPDQHFQPPPRYLGSQQNNRTQPRWHNQRRHSGLQLSTYRDHVVVYQRINSCSRRRRILGSSPAAKLRMGLLVLRLQLNLANGFNGTWKKWATAVIILSIEAAVTSYNMRFCLSLSHRGWFYLAFWNSSAAQRPLTYHYKVNTVVRWGES